MTMSNKYIKYCDSQPTLKIIRFTIRYNLESIQQQKHSAMGQGRTEKSMVREEEAEEREKKL